MHTRWLLIPIVAFTAHVTAAHMSSPPQPGSDVPPLDRSLPRSIEPVYRKLSSAFSRDRAMQLVVAMSRGWRLAGNPAYESSQQLIGDALAASGFRVQSTGRSGSDSTSAQWYEEYPLNTPAWEPVFARLTVVDDSLRDRPTAASSVLVDSSREIDRVSVCINSFSTPETGTRAPLVYVGRGTEADYRQSGDVRGKIVLGDADAGRLFEQAVRQRGAIGVLSAAAEAYTRADETPDLVQWSGIRYDEAVHGFGFKVSRRVASLLKGRLASGAVLLNAEIVTRFVRKPARTLVAEIRGSQLPDERVVIVAHVQEPGANDNASGCATLLEIARGLAAAIADGAIARPARTITFLWGDEISQSRQWLRADPSRAAGVRYAFSLDMTGEDVSKTGGTFLIEKQPDPSAVWVRPSDPHTEWGSGSVSAESLKGNLLNDVHLAICLRRARETGWVVKANPYEGGSDHSVFLAAGIPALLDWHFTDRYYHTNMDTPDKTSPAEMANVGVAVGTTAWLLSSAKEQDAAAVVSLLEQAAQARLALEQRQSADAIRQAKGAESVRSREEMVQAAWKKWYREALQSVLALPTTQTAALEKRVTNAVERVDRGR